MRRREFIAAFGSAAAWPFMARAQPASMPVIGFLDNSAPDQSFRAAFIEGLSQSGYNDGRNVLIEFRWAEGHNERLPTVADDLVRRQVRVIPTVNTPSVLAAKAATQTIPIIFGVGVDPVATELVASLNHPGGNLTGITQLSAGLTENRLSSAPRRGPPPSLLRLRSTVVPFYAAYTSQADIGPLGHFLACASSPFNPRQGQS
jgi:putative ABC transport system substrate-binding protein